MFLSLHNLSLMQLLKLYLFPTATQTIYLFSNQLLILLLVGLFFLSISLLSKKVVFYFIHSNVLQCILLLKCTKNILKQRMLSLEYEKSTGYYKSTKYFTYYLVHFFFYQKIVKIKVFELEEISLRVLSNLSTHILLFILEKLFLSF